MKTLKFLVIVVLSLASLNLSAQKSKKLKANEARVLYSVVIDCEGCVKTLNDKVPFIVGIKDLHVNLEKQTIALVYRKDKTDVKKIAVELEKLGYPAKEIKKVATKGTKEVKGDKKRKKLAENEAEVLYSTKIDCAGCEKTLNDKVPFITGIKDLKVSLDKQTIYLVYRKDKTDLSKISEELKKLGYPVVEVKK